MEENKYDYNPEEDNFDYLEEDYEQEQNEAVKKSLLGYRVVVLLLIVILAGVSVLYFNLNRQQQETMEVMAQEHKALEIERDTIASNFASLREEYAALGIKNDSISAELLKGDSIIAQLKKERVLNYRTIKKYQKEVGTLRAVMKNYLNQIDSLNKANKKLSGENITLRKEVSTAKLRADKAEEREKELENKVKIGSVLKARGINIAALNAKQRPVSRIKQATTLRVGFTLAANELAQPGPRQVYLCIYGPDGYLIGSSSFSHNGKSKSCSASREVDYQNDDLGVNIFYTGSGKDFLPGKYKVELYMNGALLGRTTQALE
jgi:hypothetical protein